MSENEGAEVREIASKWNSNIETISREESLEKLNKAKAVYQRIIDIINDKQIN